MRVHDSLIGGILLLLSLAVLWHIQSFPPPVGQPYGAALFPGLIAGGLAICSILLIIQGIQSRAQLVVWSEGIRSPRHLLAFFAVIASLLFYVLCAEALGFILCGIIMLSVLMWAFKVDAKWIVPIAILSTLVIHTCFYKLLKVPLPWGILQGWAW